MYIYIYTHINQVAATGPPPLPKKKLRGDGLKKLKLTYKKTYLIKKKNILKPSCQLRVVKRASIPSPSPAIFLILILGFH